MIFVLKLLRPYEFLTIPRMGDVVLAGLIKVLLPLKTFSKSFKGSKVPLAVSIR
jgi:hypothetical protein